MPNLFKLLIGVLISLFFVNTYSSNVVSDSIKIKTFEQHVKSLDYISRKTSNNKLYLNLAKSYCDSILKFDSKNTFANKFKDKIDLTLSANELNMNHPIIRKRNFMNMSKQEISVSDHSSDECTDIDMSPPHKRRRIIRG